MISKIIQKEKERQEELLKNCTTGNTVDDFMFLFHKQSLINLKEYMENEFNFLYYIVASFENNPDILVSIRVDIERRIYQLKEDIAELTKMIERYE